MLVTHGTLVFHLTCRTRCCDLTSLMLGRFGGGGICVCGGGWEGRRGGGRLVCLNQDFIP